MTRHLHTLAIVALALLAPLAAGQEEEELTADQIVRKANQVAYYQGGTGRADVEMTIYNADGEVRGRRELVILRRNDSVDEDSKDSLDQKMYAYFLKPADVRGTVFRVWKNADPDEDDDRWLYSPGLDLVNRIASGDKRTSFVGTHFFYEDVSGRQITDDEHELRQTTKNYYLVRSRPKEPDMVEFSHFDTYILRSNFMPYATYYYDKEGDKYREYQVMKIEKIDGFPTVTRAVMRDLREQGPKTAHTVAEYSDVEYGIDLPEDIFTERYMRKAPRQYID
jgi:hypothetical protein